MIHQYSKFGVVGRVTTQATADFRVQMFAMVVDTYRIR
jgi:hypothetical protein